MASGVVPGTEVVGDFYVAGKLGVGTTSPGGDVLHVKGGSSGGTGWSDTYDTVFENDDHSAVNIVAPSDKNSEVVFSDDARFRGCVKYNHSEDAMYFGTAGVGDRLYVGSDGNVGIGLTNPNQKLYVRQDSVGLSYPLKVENKHTVPNEAAVGILFSTGGYGSNDRGKGALAYEYTSTWNRGSFHILQDSGANSDNPDLADAVVTVDNDGEVGVGTTSPARKLHVNDVMRLEPRSSAPASPSMGDIYMDSGTRKLMVYDGSNWQACW